MKTQLPNVSRFDKKQLYSRPISSLYLRVLTTFSWKDESIHWLVIDKQTISNYFNTCFIIFFEQKAQKQKTNKKQNENRLFQLLKCAYLQDYSVFYVIKNNDFGLWTVGQSKQFNNLKMSAWDLSDQTNDREYNYKYN